MINVYDDPPSHFENLLPKNNKPMTSFSRPMDLEDTALVVLLLMTHDKKTDDALIMIQ